MTTHHTFEIKRFEHQRLQAEIELVNRLLIPNAHKIGFLPLLQLVRYGTGMEVRAMLALPIFWD